MKKICCLLLTICLLLCLAGCDTYAIMNRYPVNKSTVWFCSEIDFEIRYVPNEYGHLAPQPSTLEWNGVTYAVGVDFFAGYFTIFKDKGGAPTAEEDDLLIGEWRYEDGNVVVEIMDDYIFDNAFEELVFEPIARDE